MPRAATAIIILSTAALSLYLFSGSLPQSISSLQSKFTFSDSKMSSTTEQQWKSDLEGWFSRLTAHPSPDSVVPKREELVLAVLRNSRIEPDGHTLSIFAPSSSDPVVIDSTGDPHILSNTADFAGIKKLAEKVKALPKPETFRNMWMVDRPITGQPIDRILVPGGDTLDETSVQGFTKTVGGLSPALKQAVDGRNTLPEELGELTGLVQEARENHDVQKGKQSLLIRKVLDIVGPEVGLSA